MVRFRVAEWPGRLVRVVRRSVGGIALAGAGCVFRPPPATTPLRLVADDPARPTEHLVVFLRGRSNRPEEFQETGFFDLARQWWPEARFVAPDLHLGYYLARAATERLHHDVVAPALAGGTRTVTLVGVSLGGLGALLFALEHPGTVDEVILLAPYLGESEVWREIQAAGGLDGWQPGEPGPADFSRRLWSDLQQQWLRQPRTLQVRLACGKRDRFLESNRFFAQTFLQPADVAWVPGGHDWTTWRRGFRELMPSP